MKLLFKVKNKFLKILYNSFGCSFFCPKFIRYFLLRIYGVKIGKHSLIRDHIYMDSNKVIVGNNSAINVFTKFFTPNQDYSDGYVYIGDNCNIGYSVTFCTVSHEISNSSRRAGNHIVKTINVGNGVWICANSSIYQGVNIGDGVIIAANSVVIRDCEPNCMYAGVPAKKIKEL